MNGCIEEGSRQKTDVGEIEAHRRVADLLRAAFCEDEGEIWPYAIHAKSEDCQRLAQDKLID